MINRLYSWYGKRVVRGIGALIGVLFVVGLIITFTGNGENVKTEAFTRTVEVARVSDLNNGANISTVGSVRAVSEVNLQSEASGRITNVYASLGEQIASGQTIATIENASEYAALIQAEGAYDAAVAAAASSDVGVDEAKSDAVFTYRDAYTTVNGIVLNTVDQIYINPRRQVPGVEINASGWTLYLNDKRYELNDVLKDWKDNAAVLTTTYPLTTALQDAEKRTKLVLELTEKIITLLPKQYPDVYTESQLSTVQSSFVTAQASLNAVLTDITNAKDALARAAISGSGGSTSAADASVKQALGSLRAAQAQYAKTIIKTPIAGTVNELSVQTGDYVSVLSPIAIVANNDALEITTFVSELERDRIAVGSAVTIEGAYEGVVTNIAPAVNSATKKIEVKIQTESAALSNGDTVRLEINALGEKANTDNAPLVVPITALKVGTDNIVVFTTDPDGTLVAHEVVEGPLLGSNIVIESGITRDMEIVLDARGLTAGDEVTVVPSSQK